MDNIYYVTMGKQKKKYGFGNFLFDLVMLCLTAGLWLIWIIIREIQR